MKKIIKGKVYDTAKAKLVYTIKNEFMVTTFNIYKKRTGEYFIYSFHNDEDTYDHLMPVDIDFVKDLLEPFTEIYDKEFGITDKDINFSLSLTSENYRNLREYASKNSMSVSSLINSIVSIYFEDRYND